MQASSLIQPLTVPSPGAQPVDPLHYQVLQSIAIDGYWRVDLDGTLVEVNDAYCRMSGYTREELIGMHVAELDAMETGEAARDRIQRIVETAGERFVTRHRCKGGELLEIEVSAAFVPAENGYIIAFLR